MSTRLRAGRIGAPDVVSTMLAFSQYGNDARFTPLTPVGATPESYLFTTTPVLKAGIYQIMVVQLITGSAQGTDLQAVLKVDGFTFPPLLTEANIAGGGFILSGLPDQDWTASDSTHTLELLVAHPSGPGAVTCLIGSFSWERKA